MKRPWQVWLVFVACLACVAAAMSWLTRQALDADRLRRVAEADAELEQRVSLALWRMDTELAPLVAQEVIRPPSDYRPQSPLLNATPPYAVLHCEARPDGTWYSPQPGRAEQLADLAAACDVKELVAELPDTPLPSIRVARQEQFMPTTPALNGDDELFDDDGQFFAGNRTLEAAENTSPKQSSQKRFAKGDYPVGEGSKRSKAADLEQRAERYQSAARQSLLNTQQQAHVPNLPPDFDSANLSAGIEAPLEQVGVSRPLWIGDRLLLARQVGAGGETMVQSVWLDWPYLKRRLLGEAAGLLPGADLVPVSGSAAADPGRMLAGLPVRLVLGESAAIGPVGPTLQWALWMGWGALILAAGAAAALLQGVMTLSERRAAFVSSVTHELRTPLTTFRMYAEMLARGMVPDAQRRQEYFQTLQREAERLTLLVENVLAYARLERGRKPQAIESTTVSSLMERIGPRLAQRAQQAGMQCDVQINNLPLPLGEGQDEGKSMAPNSPSRCPFPKGKGFDNVITTDLNVVEQILFNLVDNAAKYARAASDPRIHVIAGNEKGSIRFTVRDHGPGFEPRHVGRRMRAFGKSAQESAESAPGVGLGLALCRRLAHQLGGRLDIEAAPGGGAMATLVLPSDGLNKVTPDFSANSPRG